MRRLWLFLAASVACTGNGPTKPAASAAQGGDGKDAVTAPAAVSTVALEELPSRTYRAAFDQAQKEITVDNAAERLRALERAIEVDSQGLP